MGAQGTTTGRADVRERDETAPLPATLHDDPARSDEWDPVDRLTRPQRLRCSSNRHPARPCRRRAGPSHAPSGSSSSSAC